MTRRNDIYTINFISILFPISAFVGLIFDMECLPLKTYEELDSWSSGDLRDCRVSTVPLADRKGRPKGIPKTLVCHDMCGGYLTDRYNSIMVYYIS